ncbi:hypothetical protein GCM10025738_25890 [Microbacterium fluvii]
MDVIERPRFGRAVVIVIVVTAVLGFVAAMCTTSAYSGTANSSWGYYSLNGQNYKNQAVVETTPSTNSITGATNILTNETACIPSGWAGARARIFNSSGALIIQSDIRYNSGCALSHANLIYYTAAGAWYSYGVTWAWSGSSYNAFYTFKSPRVCPRFCVNGHRLGVQLSPRRSP